MITTLLILTTAITSVLAFRRDHIYYRLLFNAWQIKYRNEYWRFLSYGLVHAGWGHLLINMMVLYSFGSNVEDVFVSTFGLSNGSIKYLGFYILSIFISTLWDYVKHKDNVHYNAVGASGAVSAVLFSSILISPNARLIVFPLPIPIPAYLFGILYLLYTIVMARKNNDNIGHAAHLTGALFGLIFTFILLHDPLIAMYLS